MSDIDLDRFAKEELPWIREMLGDDLYDRGLFWNKLKELEEAFEACYKAWKDERERCARIAETGTNLPGEMPDKLWETVLEYQNNRSAMAALFRTFVQRTKEETAKEIREGG